MANAVTHRFETFAEEAAIGTFADYGVSLERASPASPPPAMEVSLCGVIGFTGPHIVGTFMMAATDWPIQASNPATADGRDWIGELANQILGRIKNRLLRGGIEIFSIPPAVLRGRHLAPVHQRPELSPIVFGVKKRPEAVVCLWCDVLVGSEADEWRLSPASDEIPTEGSVQIFED